MIICAHTESIIRNLSHIDISQVLKNAESEVVVNMAEREVFIHKKIYSKKKAWRINNQWIQKIIRIAN